MLNDSDRRMLADIERHICADDPGLARSFETTGAHLGKRSCGPRRWPYTAVAIIALVLAGVSLVLALPDAFLTSAVMAAGAFALRALQAPPGPP